MRKLEIRMDIYICQSIAADKFYLLMEVKNWI